MGRRWAAYGTARAPNGCIFQPSTEHADTAGTALLEAAHRTHLWIKADWYQLSVFPVRFDGPLPQHQGLASDGEDCELRSTRFDIDQSFLGLDRIRCAWNARHNMLCNTTYRVG